MSRHHSQKGTILLVALCFVAVLGISLASYIAVCSRTMQLSNRTFQAGLSRQLAELGLEEAMRAFNKHNWADWSNGTAVDWTLDTTNKRATATITFPAGKFGQGATGSVKIRVDNYDVRQLNANWASGMNYRVGDLVGDNGIWYRCIKVHTSGASNRPVNWNYWVQEGIPWTWDSARAYSVEDLIVYNEVWYRCQVANTNKPPPSNATEWQPLVAIYTSVPAWPYTTGSEEALLFSGGGLVKLTTSTWGTNPPYQWRWRDAQSYKLNDVVYYNGIWYRSSSNHTSDWNNYPTGWATVWSAVTDMWNWSNSTTYNLNDVVYHSGSSSWYRCIQANSGQTPSSSSAYWSNAPRWETEWNSSRQYGANDVTYYNGVWYLSLQGSNYGQNPATATSYWASAADASYQWNSTTAYSANTYRSYDRVWYKSLATSTGQSPNDTTYWTAAWAQTSGVTTGAPVIYAEGTVNIAGGGSAKTQLRATIAPAPLFPNGLGATTLVRLPTSATIDSYDSSLGTYNQTTTPYSAGSPNRGSSAVVAGGNTGGTAVTLTSARVNGYVSASPASTSPYAPNWTYGGTAIVTNVASPTVPGTRVDLTRVSRSPYIPQFDIQTVSGGTTITLPSGSTTRLGTPGATTPSIYTISGNLDRTAGASTDILMIVGPVIMNVTGRLYLTAGRIVIASTGSLQVRFGGQLWVGGGSPVATVQNLTYDPKKCILIGTSTGNSAGSHYYWSTDNFYGVIYMPSAYLSTWTNVPIYGALSARNIAFPQAGGQLHYDTSLRYTTIPGVDQPYGITEWRELTDTSERITLP